MGLSVNIEKQLGSFCLTSSLEAPDGTTALLGASGCGKTMTLKCIAGIVKPDRGRIVLNGRVLFDKEKGINLPPQERKVGYLFQNYALFPNMTVEKNLLCAAPGSRREKADLLAETLRRFRLEGLEKRYPAQLSGGQQQRVALARILCGRPEAILLDEPLSALDSSLKWDLELEIGELLWDFPGPIVWVSHHRGEVFRNCSRVCVMEQGRTQPIQTREQLFRTPQTPAAARLAGWENILPAIAKGQSVTLTHWGLTLDWGRPVPRETSHAAIRAASITPAQPGTPGAFPCRVVRVIQDIPGCTLLLQPEPSHPGAPYLRMQTQDAPREDILWVTVRAEDILLLSGNFGAP